MSFYLGEFINRRRLLTKMDAKSFMGTPGPTKHATFVLILLDVQHSNTTQKGFIMVLIG